MEKLRLNVEELRVQSFATDDPGTSRGTVHGQAGMLPSRQISQCCHTDEFQSCPARCTP